MFDHLGTVIMNQSNLLVEDKPYIFEGLIRNPQEIATWNDIENCLNNPALYEFEMIGIMIKPGSMNCI